MMHINNVIYQILFFILHLKEHNWTNIKKQI